MVKPHQVLILIAAAFFVWRIGVVGMSSHYAQSITEGERDAARKALAWDGRRPEALYQRAIALRNDDPNAAAALLIRANTHHMTDARPFLAAAEATFARGDRTRADALVETALRLRPADPRIQRQAGNHWILRNDVARAIRHWSLAMEASSSARRELSPRLLKLAENPHTRSAYEALAADPPSWWNSFFSKVARRATEIETVHRLYSLRRKSRQAPITLSERKNYIARLKKDGLIEQAYYIWVNGLTPAQWKEWRRLYNGDFELEMGNWGFDWHTRTSRSTLITREYSYGNEGNKSLHLQFDRHRGRFEGLYQMLFLNAGTYQLSGRVHTDGLDTQGGLKWVARCLLPRVESLGESRRFLGTNEWRDFGFEFQVPDTCTLQELRLISAGKRASEHRITGDAWFDRMLIHKKLPPAKVRDAKVKGAGYTTGSGSDPTPSS